MTVAKIAYFAGAVGFGAYAFSRICGWPAGAPASMKVATLIYALVLASVMGAAWPLFLSIRLVMDARNRRAEARTRAELKRLYREEEAK